jgi:hypothetical protein
VTDAGVAAFRLVFIVAEKSPLTVATGVAALRLVFIVAEKSPLTVATGVAALSEVFMAAVKSPTVGALVRLVAVVTVPAVMLVGLATDAGKVTPAAAVTV